MYPQILQSLEKDLISFRGCIESIGSQFDSHENRREIRRLRTELKKKITTAEGNLKKDKSKYDHLILRSSYSPAQMMLLASSLTGALVRGRSNLSDSQSNSTLM